MKLLEERIWSLFKRHWQQTLTHWSVFFSFGLCIAFLGPTILDLRCQTQSTLQQITWVFFSQQFFLLVGSSMGGLCKKTPVFSLSALLSSTLIISLVFAIIPLCHHVAVLSVAMALAGTAMGVIDTIANLQLVKLYQRDSAIFLQALHFFIGLGALVSPLVADPFLAEDSCVLGANWTTNASSSSDLQHLRSSLAGHGTALHNISQYPLHTEGVIITRVSYAFWIMALINLPVPAAVLALMYHERLLPCFMNSPRLLDRDSLSSTSPTGDSGHGHGNVFGCCNLEKLRGRPASFFILHALGLVCWFCLHLCCLPSSADGSQDCWLSGQYILGIHHSRKTGFHLPVLPIHSTQVAHLQSGGSHAGTVHVVDLLHKLCVSVHRYLHVGTVHQQCVSLCAGLYRGHTRLQRLCHNCPGDQCQHRRDDATAACWIGDPQSGQLRFPVVLYNSLLHRLLPFPAAPLCPADPHKMPHRFIYKHRHDREAKDRRLMI
ncbi:major facilitator superfamily domain-containing protein 4A-like isoform X2 [Seriola lalandi dorsalis]|uniref:major facilitator superfamily domain-containing protein 4A-like isoform X2 n=1 Tax=Seriola lalandi dorsalis TaxID=1841481 RepID=UPI000C6F5355|nr:major facilitator superfamily domain-containing protein 4A-like isoform X2 [Seriola lalandi dorsalis]